MGDVVSVVEAAYRTDADEQQWIEGVLTAARPWLDSGVGAAAFLYDASDRTAPPRVWSPVAIGNPWAEHVATILPLALAAVPADLTRRFFAQSIPFSTASAEVGLDEEIGEFPMFRDRLQQFGMVDSLTVCAADPASIGCFLCGPCGKPTRVSRADRALWTRLAAHIAAGARLRRGSPTVEAVLTPSGRVEHAEGAAIDARAELAEEAKRIDRARAGLRRRDPDEALDVWRGLVDGTWSLVEQFDRDGRRYIVARRNPPALRETAKTLTTRERQVLGYAARGWSNKSIGYCLGISLSAVSTHLTSAARKLGVRGRIDAVRVFNTLPDEGAP